MTVTILDHASASVMPSNEKTVLRGGYGGFYGRTPAIMVSSAHSNNGINILGVTLNCLSSSKPLSDLSKHFHYAAGYRRATPEYFSFSDSYQQPTVQQGRIGVEREIFKNVSVAVNYLYFRGTHLARTRDINLCPAGRDHGNRSDFRRNFHPAALSRTGWLGRLADCVPQATSFTTTTPLRPLLNSLELACLRIPQNPRYHGLTIQSCRPFFVYFVDSVL